MQTERAPRVTLLLFLLSGLGLIGAAIGLSQIVGTPTGEEHVIVIPAGTGDRLASGETVEIIPADLRFRLRDRLVVINEDDQVHQVGPFTVAPGDRLEERFSEAATIEGFCSLHPSGRVTIEIGGG